jgi:hypothetical protein
MAGFEREISQTLLLNKDVVSMELDYISGMRNLEYWIAKK